MKWKLTKDLPELNGKIFPSQMDGFSFQVVSASKKQGLEIVALDDVNERYTLFDIPTFEKTEAMGFTVEDKGKWYALMMQVPLQKLGVASKADALILNVKIHPEDKERLIATDGIFEAYHMNKKHWISIALNVCSDDALVKECIYTSYKCVAKKDNPLLSTRDSL